MSARCWSGAGRWGTIPVLTLFGLLVACGGGGSSASPTQTAVPGVIGDTQSAATTAITGAGLVVGTVTAQSSATVASGNVISESPAAGINVADGSAVNLVVSSGASQAAIPNVVGDSQAAATTAIANAGLVVGTVTYTFDATVAVGIVVSTDPTTGSNVAAGSAVNLLLSSGATQVSVPDVVGDTLTTATISITNAHLGVGSVTQQSSSTVTPGRIISESPAAGSGVPPGLAVNIVLSSGSTSSQVAVPEVVGVTQASATTAITGAGLVVGTVTAQSSSTVPSGEVISEVPSAGTNVTSGSPVNLTLSSGLATSPAETVMHSFGLSATDGNGPLNVIQASDGNFYGITEYGGTYNNGTIFKITPGGVESVILSFGAPTGNFLDDGEAPLGGIMQASDGNFYVTTTSGGQYGNGTVNKVGPDGTETLLHSFAGGNDGAYPEAALIQSTDGNLYGTTSGGGASGNGTVFRITPAGDLTNLYSFAGGVDASSPVTALVQASDGNLYGTTSGGGNGWGTVFKIAPSGAETVVYSFTNTTDGAHPSGALIQGSDNNLYGLTEEGGQNFPNGTVGGVLFKLSLTGALTVVHSFGASGDGDDPSGRLLQGSDGSLYGTTNGIPGSPISGPYGTVFKVTATGSETVLYSFKGGLDGDEPRAGIILGSDGAFYGTTFYGGTSNNALGTGTVFKLVP
jgi:uncharacterized repeat protein (TIGR03803 family)